MSDRDDKPMFAPPLIAWQDPNLRATVPSPAPPPPPRPATPRPVPPPPPPPPLGVVPPAAVRPRTSVPYQKQNPAVYLTPPRRPPSMVIAYLLWFFGGFFGCHRYYLGKYITGVLMFVTAGGAGLWWVLDGLTLWYQVQRRR